MSESRFDGREVATSDRAAGWINLGILASVVVIVSGLIWIGYQADYGAQPLPNADPAMANPAWHPGDPGVIDLRGGNR